MNDTRVRCIALALLALSLNGCQPATPELDLPPVPPLGALPGAVPDALREAIEAFENDQLDPDLNGALAMQLHAHHLTTQAAALYARARHLDPDGFRWAYLHGIALRTLGDHGAATAAVRAALRLRPAHPGAQLALARLLQAGGDADAAQELYAQLVDRNPTYAQAFDAYGKFLLERGEAERAIDMLETALGLFNRYGQAHYTLALAHRELGRLEQATLHAALFERYRSYQPPPYDTVLARMASMNQSGTGAIDRAMALVAAGRAHEAIEALEALAAASPGSLTPRLPLIDIYGQLGEYDTASDHAGAALTLDPGSVAVHDNIGVLRLRQGRYDEAVNSFRRAIGIDPEFAGLHKNLGMALEAAGRRDDALSSYRTAVGLDPFDRQSVYLLARALVQANRPAEAVPLLESITRFEHPETARYFQLMGSAQATAGDWDAATASFERAIALANRYGLGDVRAEASAQLDVARRSRP